MSNTVKSKFVGLFRRVLGRSNQSPTAPPPAARPISSAAPASAARPPFLPVPSSANVNEIILPLAPIMAGLPMELRGKVMSVPSPGMTITLPVETVTSQLALGVVKISFGDLRHLAPGIFSNAASEYDGNLISLPLGEILPRMNPTLLARQNRRRVEVANDITGPFGARGQEVVFTTQPLKAPPAPAPAAPLAPKISVASPAAPMPGLAPTAPIAPRAMMPAPTAPVPPSPPPVRPAMKISIPPPASAPRPEPAQPTLFALLGALSENWPAELQQEIMQAALANEKVPLAVSVVEAGLKRGRVMLTWQQLRTLVRPSSSPSPNDSLELELPLKVITPLFLDALKNTPKAVKKTAVSEEIPNLFFGFPQPPPAAPVAPPAAALPVVPPTPLSPPAPPVPLSAPIKMAAPVSLPKPVEPPAEKVEKKSADSNFYFKGDSLDASKGEANEFMPPSMPQTDFTSRHAPPKEVVARAKALPGVAGVIITLPDGLRVASEVPAEFNADSLAAFIPQIFERMNQSARELRMGALNNVSFTVGNVPWRIFRVNAVYLAAFGRLGEALPTAQLAALAGELDRKKSA